MKYSGDLPAWFYSDQNYNSPKDPTLLWFQRGARQAGIKSFNLSSLAPSPRENAVYITVIVNKEYDRWAYELHGTYYRADPHRVLRAPSPCWSVGYSGATKSEVGLIDLTRDAASDLGKEFARAWLYQDISKPVKRSSISVEITAPKPKPPKTTANRPRPSESHPSGIIADQGRVLRPCYVMSKADPKATRLQRLNKGDLIWVIDSPNAKWLTVIQGESKIGYVWRECISLKS